MSVEQRQAFDKVTGEVLQRRVSIVSDGEKHITI